MKQWTVFSGQSSVKAKHAGNLCHLCNLRTVSLTFDHGKGTADEL